MPRAKPKFEELSDEYADLFSRIDIKPSWRAACDRMCGRILDNKVRYRVVSDATGVPWFWIGAVHAMESGVRFSTHLHNGDPLSARTRNVPAGYPRSGRPPFEWTDSAVDALQIKNLQNVPDWTLPRMLYELERFNGWGYRLYHAHVLSPYLWSGSALYRRGKYVSDGRWSETHVSQQVGAACLLYRLAELDESVDLQVPAANAESFAEPDEEIEVDIPLPERKPAIEGDPVPVSFPKAEETRVVDATRKSWTITGAATAALGAVVNWGEKTVDVLLETAQQLVAWAPAQTVAASMVGNVKSIGLSLTAFGLVLVVSRRLNAADKGKIG